MSIASFLLGVELSLMVILVGCSNQSAISKLQDPNMGEQDSGERADRSETSGDLESGGSSKKELGSSKDDGYSTDGDGIDDGTTDEEITDEEITDNTDPGECGRFHNPNMNLDTDGDGFISPIDTLIIGSYINANGEQTVPASPDESIPNAAYESPNDELFVPVFQAPEARTHYYDTNGDCVINTADAQLINDHLNNQ